LSLGFTSHLTQNTSFGRRSLQPISRLSTEQLNQTQQKQTCICNKIYYNTNHHHHHHHHDPQNEHKN